MIFYRGLFTWLFISLVTWETAAAATINHRDPAWDVLKTGLQENSADKRAQAVLALGVLPGDRLALELVLKAASDEKPEVRTAAATALGQFHRKSSVAALHKLLSDPEPAVALAAASALMPSKDPEAFEVYYEFLTGMRKTGKGLVATQMKMLKDPKKMAQLGVEQGIGFVPYAGIALSAFKTLHADDVSPVRAAAAKMIANDPDPESGRALVEVTTDKSWVVKTAALEAIAKRGDPQLLDGILPAMMDENNSVRCTAAAAVIRLSTIAMSRNSKPQETQVSRK
jgi:HEAT repeat protein